LFAADPAGQGGDENLPGLEDSGHPRIMLPSQQNRQLSACHQTAYNGPGGMLIGFLDITGTLGGSSPTG
jgi:hypothetical protein